MGSVRGEKNKGAANKLEVGAPEKDFYKKCFSQLGMSTKSKVK